jgi:hypothetical protein
LNFIGDRIGVMENDKKKDALTDLVDVAVSVGDTPSDRPLKDGEAVTPSGEVVTMGIDDKELTDLARRLLKWAKTKQGSEYIKKYLADK